MTRAWSERPPFEIDRSRRRLATLLARSSAVVALAILTGCGQPDGAPPASVAETRLPRLASDSVKPFVVETLATGLSTPWAMAFVPDGRVLLTERAGRVRVLERDTLRAEPWATLNVFAENPVLLPESGLMGIALAPDYTTTGFVYVVGTFYKGDEPPSRSIGARIGRRLRALVAPMSVLAYESRIYRLRDRDGRGVEPHVVVAGLPSNFYHAGGALAFGPDGMLWVTIGDVLHPSAAPDDHRLAGKVLRYRPDGSIPDDNPIPGSPVFARGLRNVQGLAWHPTGNALFAIEHGPTGMPQERLRQGQDELNVILPNGDYGWPSVTGRERGRFQTPVAVWGEAIAPAGLAAYAGDALPWHGDLLISGLRGQALRRIRLAPPGRESEGVWQVLDEQLLLEGYGRLRAVAVGPDGAVYVTTSNLDGRGTPGPADDLLLRLRPRERRRPD